MDIPKQRNVNGYQMGPSLKLSNGYILPEGKMTPNTLFVGGIDTKVDENEIKDFFARYGPIKEVKIITYRGGICKGYGFVYFNEDVDIQTIVEQQISFKGRKLKLGPAIMKERSSRYYAMFAACSVSPVCGDKQNGALQSHFVGSAPWMTPPQYIYCSCCPPTVSAPPNSPVLNTTGQYLQPYPYSSLPGVMIPQMPVGYAQTACAYQYASPHWTGEQRTRLINQGFLSWHCS